MEPSEKNTGTAISFEDFKKRVLNDYRLAYESRQASLIGRKEVLTGKAKFGIFGDGKEVAQVAMARTFQKGDFRSGYYRDMTFMFAIGESDFRKFFAQLYAIPDIEEEPASGGRSMNGHYATRSLNADGSWKNLMEIKNSSADISPTAGQMPRLVGLALASKLYRENEALHGMTEFSDKGNEVAFGTIGDASTSEGLFFEAINAAGVLKVPMAISVWDDGYGISVPAKYQTTKQNISEILKGLELNEKGEGYKIFRAKGWDYPGLCEMYEKGIAICREHHVPVFFHVQEITQPQGHSTSGSHERYKSEQRLAWEEEYDCLRKMKEWMIASAIATQEEIEALEAEAKTDVNTQRKLAWEAYNAPIRAEKAELVPLLNNLSTESSSSVFITRIREELEKTNDASRRDVSAAARRALYVTRGEQTTSRQQLVHWLDQYAASNRNRYNTYLHSQSAESALAVEALPPQYEGEAKMLDGREILNANFDLLFEKDPRLVAFGEDLGKIGDVNQGFAGLQQKYGEIRISDAGIREATIVGQGIGLAMRGLRPIAEIQYLDYLLYAIQILSDDLATLQYRTAGGQKAPVIIRTRGHRLEGIWHSGSPMGMIINAVRGIYVLVPRDMTRAAGFYNTMLASDEPAIIVEPLNGYRLKEQLPSNIGEYRIALGVPEILREGSDVTLVTYGSCCRIAMDATKHLAEMDISVEIIDVQSLLPFDLNHRIAESVQKTGKLLILDEDVPGGASAFILQQVLEEQQAFQYLDSAPRTLASKAHRPAYGSDGDYFSKPNVEDVVETIYAMMSEYHPQKFPPLS